MIRNRCREYPTSGLRDRLQIKSWAERTDTEEIGRTKVRRTDQKRETNSTVRRTEWIRDRHRGSTRGPSEKQSQSATRRDRRQTQKRFGRTDRWTTYTEMDERTHTEELAGTREWRTETDRHVDRRTWLGFIALQAL